MRALWNLQGALFCFKILLVLVFVLIIESKTRGKTGTRTISSDENRRCRLRGRGELLRRHALSRRAGSPFPAPLRLRGRAPKRCDRPQSRRQLHHPPALRQNTGGNRFERPCADRTENDSQRSIPEIAPSIGRATDCRRHAAKRFGQHGTIGAALFAGTDSQRTLFCLPPV